MSTHWMGLVSPPTPCDCWVLFFLCFSVGEEAEICRQMDSGLTSWGRISTSDVLRLLPDVMQEMAGGKNYRKPIVSFCVEKPWFPDVSGIVPPILARRLRQGPVAVARQMVSIPWQMGTMCWTPWRRLAAVLGPFETVTRRAPKTTHANLPR